MNNGKGEMYSRGSERRVGLGSVDFNANLAFLHQSYSGMEGSEQSWRCGKLEMLSVVCPCHPWVTTQTLLKSLTLPMRAELRLAASDCGGSLAVSASPERQ